MVGRPHIKDYGPSGRGLSQGNGKGARTGPGVPERRQGGTCTGGSPTHLSFCLCLSSPPSSLRVGSSSPGPPPSWCTWGAPHPSTHILSAYSIPSTGDTAGPKMGRAPAPLALAPHGTKQTKVKYESVASPALRTRPYPEIGSWRVRSVPTSREWRLRTRRGRTVPHTGARPREDRETGPQAKDPPQGVPQRCGLKQRTFLILKFWRSEVWHRVSPG